MPRLTKEEQGQQEEEKQKALEILGNMLLEGTELTFVLKRISSNGTSNFYSVFMVWEGHITCLDYIIARANFFTYSLARNKPNGLEAHNPWTIAGRLSIHFYGRSKAFQINEVR